MKTTQIKHLIRAFAMVSVVAGGVAIYMSREFPSLRSQIAPVYPASTTAFSLVISGGGIFQAGDCRNASFGSKCFGWAIVAPLGLAALPTTLVVDTILLPLDLYRYRKGEWRLVQSPT